MINIHSPKGIFYTCDFCEQDKLSKELPKGWIVSYEDTHFCSEKCKFEYERVERIIRKVSEG